MLVVPLEVICDRQLQKQSTVEIAQHSPRNDPRPRLPNGARTLVDKNSIRFSSHATHVAMKYKS